MNADTAAKMAFTLARRKTAAAGRLVAAPRRPTMTMEQSVSALSARVRSGEFRTVGPVGPDAGVTVERVRIERS